MLARLLKYPLLLIAFAVLVPGGVVAAGLVGSGGIKDNSIRSRDVLNNTLRSKDVADGTLKCGDLTKSLRNALCKAPKQGPKGDAGDRGPGGPTGGQGNPGATGPPGDDAQTRITTLPGPGFDGTNSSVVMTADGVKFGPYADGGAAGGSLYYDGLNGHPLSDVANLIYRARYQSDGDTGGVGVPYLRIFLDGDTHDAIFSPNTQPPDSDTAEGPFHTWAATSGLWRYDDDGGSGGQYGLNGAPFGTVVGDHGSAVISGIYVSTGFSSGINLEALLRSWSINGENFVFGS